MTFGRLHLKTVEIVGFEARCVGLKFVTGLVQFLLKHVRVLEKLVIYGKAEAFSWGSIRTLINNSFIITIASIHAKKFSFF